MASIAMTSSFIGSTTSLSKLPATTTTARRVMVVTPKVSAQKIENVEEERSSKRRDLFVGAAAAAMCSIAKAAMADEEPKRGTPDAKKKYGPVCIANPTARICRN